MTANEKQIRLLIRKQLSEMYDISESDILVRAGVDWDEVKPKFLEKINDLVSKIDDDKYDDAEDLIGNVTNMLKVWKAKIHKGKQTDMVDKKSYSETLDEYNDFSEEDGDYIEQPKEDPEKRQQKNKKIRFILHAQGKNNNSSQQELNKLSYKEIDNLYNSAKETFSPRKL